MKMNYVKLEIDIHQSLNHNRIVSLLDHIEIDSETFCTILECCSGPDLAHFLKKRKVIPEKEAKMIVK